MQDVYKLPFILYRRSCNDYVSIRDISILFIGLFGYRHELHLLVNSWNGHFYVIDIVRLNIENI